MSARVHARALGRWLRRKLGRQRLLLIGVGLAVCAFLLTVNTLVRAHGGDAALYSVGYTGQRVRALVHLARHQLTCTGQHGDPILLVRSAALAQRISPRLAVAVARVESSLIHTRISGTGAMGLMQLMPATAAALALEDPFDPAQNAAAGTRYLAQLLRMYKGDVRRALSAYNAGMARVPTRGAYRVPAETSSYVVRVLAESRRR